MGISPWWQSRRRQYARFPVRALIVTNMYPSPERPALGSFVRDQVRALERLGDLEVELFTFGPGGPGNYVRAWRELRAGRRGSRFDVVHAHFGLTLWPAKAVAGRLHGVTLHGTDLAHPRSRQITLAGLRGLDLVVAVSEQLAGEIPRWALRRPPAVLPVGVDRQRFRPLPRREARARLGLPAGEPCLLFPADPSRPEKGYDRAQAVAGRTHLLTLGQVPPEEVPDWINAANAVLIPSHREGFGLAVLEALACEVPVLCTPVGIAPEATAGVPGTLCAPYEAGAWREFVAPLLEQPDPRLSAAAGNRATGYSTDVMARRLVDTWRQRLGEPAA
jgi:teichuronic acid biosynthesis glycosyltransferase TuaC